MTVLDNFKRKRKSLVNVIQYPNEYIIETYNSSDTGTWIRSDCITIKPIDIELAELENLITFHLDNSKKVNYQKYDLKSVNEHYKKITKRSSIKKQMENAKLISVYRINNIIELTPNENGGTLGDSKGFRPIENKRKVFNTKSDKDKIAQNVIKLFEECK